jgi:asparagine synthetase A
MCSYTIDKYDVEDVVQEQYSNLELLKTQLKGLYPIFHDEALRTMVVAAEFPEGIVAGLYNAFLTGLQLGQRLPTASYPGKPIEDELEDDEILFDEEEETELTFQSVRNS